jgi:hypothetical protein
MYKTAYAIVSILREKTYLALKCLSNLNLVFGFVF